MCQQYYLFLKVCSASRICCTILHLFFFLWLTFTLAFLYPEPSIPTLLLLFAPLQLHKVFRETKVHCATLVPILSHFTPRHSATLSVVWKGKLLSSLLSICSPPLCMIVFILFGVCNLLLPYRLTCLVYLCLNGIPKMSSMSQFGLYALCILFI